jgi:predicted metal-dependent peptidase
MTAAPDTLTKLSAARTRLILEHPFVGALVMHLPLKRADTSWCRTFASDARAFYFNPHYIDGLDFAQAQFILAHEALHCALGHFARRAHRSVRRWDLACDYAVNLLLADAGLKPAPAALIEREYRGLSAEEIYVLVPPGAPERTLDEHLAEGAGQPGSPRSPGPAEREALAESWRSRVVAAGQQARRAGHLPSSWARLIEELIQPRLPWRAVLARHMHVVAREDYSFDRPSRREGGALLPRLGSRQADVCVAFDTSGSITPFELAEFAAEVDALKAQVRARVTLLACDERLDPRGPWCFEPWEAATLPGAFQGGSGTSFVPVFDWVAHAHIRPDLLVYFTDAEGEFPQHAPEYPVAWLVKGRAGVPWGERIQL